jgi:hypothetical protein
MAIAQRAPAFCPLLTFEVQYVQIPWDEFRTASIRRISRCSSASTPTIYPVDIAVGSPGDSCHATF